MTVIEIVLMQVLFFTVGSKQKKKLWNTMVPSYHSKVSSTQNQKVPFFFLFESWSLVLYRPVWVKSKSFR